MVLRKCNVSRLPMGWSDELSWAINNLKGGLFVKVILRLGLAATIYYVWLERNARIFNNKARDPSTLLQMLASDMRNRICLWNAVENKYENWYLCLSWNLPMKILKSRTDRVRSNVKEFSFVLLC